MKRTKLALTIIATLIVIATLLVACNDQQTPPPSPADGTYRVSFAANGGSAVDAVTTKTVQSEPVTTKNGYTFAGWYDNPDLNGNRIVFPYSPTADVTLYAKWTPVPIDTYTVNFVTNGGSSVESVTAAQIQTEPVSDKDNYTFDGWYDNPEFNGSRVEFPYTPTENTTLYAKWTAVAIDYTQTELADYEYTRDDDGNITLTAYLGNAERIIFPLEDNILLGEEVLDQQNYTLTAVKIPSNIKGMADNIFVYAPLVSKIEVAENHPTLSVVDDVLFAENGTLLLAYPLAKTDKSYTVPSSVKTVGSYAFYGNENLETITVSEGVEKLDIMCFAHCTEVTSVTLPDTLTETSNSSMVNMNSLTEITFPAGLKTWGYKTIDARCTSLKRVTGPSIMKYMYDLPNLEYLEINGGETISSVLCAKSKSLKTLVISEGITMIGSTAFQQCPLLETVKIPSSVTTISGSAFTECTALTDVEFAENSKLTTLRSNAFKGCSSLKRLVLPEGLTAVESGAFDNSGLEELHLPSTLSKCCTFNNVANLTTLYCPTFVINKLYSGLTAYSKSPIETVIFISGESIPSTQGSSYTGLQSLHTLVIPACVTQIDKNAFNGCYGLVQITNLSSVDWTPNFNIYASDDIPSDAEIRRSENTPFEGKITKEDNGLVKYTYKGETRVLDCDRSVTNITAADLSEYTTIGGYAFLNCDKLTGIVIPSNIKTIGNHAFYCCTSLASVTIQDGVERIEDYAFLTTGFSSITIPHSVIYIGGTAIYSPSGSTITVTVIGYTQKPEGWNNGWCNYSTVVIWDK